MKAMRDNRESAEQVGIAMWYTVYFTYRITYYIIVIALASLQSKWAFPCAYIPPFLLNYKLLIMYFVVSTYIIVITLAMASTVCSLYCSLAWACRITYYMYRTVLIKVLNADIIRN